MSTVTLRYDGDVAMIALSRPEAGNAIDLTLARELRDAVTELSDLTDVQAVVLHGKGPSFCVGGDLHRFASAPDPAAFISELAATAHEALIGLRNLRPPVVTAIQGACAGAGIGFALAGDLVVAEENARFRSAYTAVGLTPDCGVSWTLNHRLGPARAADLILTNRAMTAWEAHAAGLISRIVAPGRALDEALELAQRLASGPGEAFARSLALVRDAANSPLENHLDAEAAAITEMIGTADAQEGVAAFLAKRHPIF